MSIELKPLATAKIQLRPPIAIENGPYGSRQVFEVVSAEFTGRFSATLKGVACADWLLVPAEGWRPSTSGGPPRRPTARSSTSTTTARATSRAGSSSRSRSTSPPRFETSDPRYAWLNKVQAVGKGIVDETLMLDYEWYEVA